MQELFKLGNWLRRISDVSEFCCPIAISVIRNEINNSNVLGSIKIVREDMTQYLSFAQHSNYPDPEITESQVSFAL